MEGGAARGWWENVKSIIEAVDLISRSLCRGEKSIVNEKMDYVNRKMLWTHPCIYANFDAGAKESCCAMLRAILLSKPDDPPTMSRIAHLKCDDDGETLSSSALASE